MPEAVGATVILDVDGTAVAGEQSSTCKWGRGFKEYGDKSSDFTKRVPGKRFCEIDLKSTIGLNGNQGLAILKTADANGTTVTATHTNGLATISGEFYVDGLEVSTDDEDVQIASGKLISHDTFTVDGE